MDGRMGGQSHSADRPILIKLRLNSDFHMPNAQTQINDTSVIRTIQYKYR